MNLTTADGLSLEAELAVPEGDLRGVVVLAHPHPQQGGSMRSVVTSELSVGRQSVAWAYVTVAVSLLLWPVATDYGIGLGYTVPAVLLGGWFVVESHRLLARIKRGGAGKSTGQNGRTTLPVQK